MPLVVTLRGSDVFGIVGSASGRYTFSGKVLTRISKWVVARADAVVLVSEQMRPFVPRGRMIRVIPSGLDLDLFRPIPQFEARHRLGWPQEDRVVLFAGKPSMPRKRCNLARHAVEMVNRQLPTRLVTAWGVPHQDMPVYMNACDVLVLTSIHEGSPNVVKEALACNVPVVTVNVGDVAERLAGIEGCHVCADDRPETIAACLEQVLRNPQRIQGRETVCHLDERILTQQIIGVYQSVVSNSRSVSESETGPCRTSSLSI
jgi:glycosyltransferase involved in cell wall biosynthesis